MENADRAVFCCPGHGHGADEGSGNDGTGRAVRGGARRPAAVRPAGRGARPGAAQHGRHRPADLAVWGARLDPGQRAWLAGICADSPGFHLGHPAEPLTPARPGIEQLAALAGPALVAVGEHDLAFTHRCADRMAQGLPGAHRVTVAGADHFVNVTAPDAFAELITAFTAARS
ncbi:alpha/beta fold hydrolase [Kitasatospora sp. NPDC101801]|uniref:alpha/beta fold hydrolase n=1 Tax=Kitasatospora sp. NPDC101801 TaxID=3364103 RepID=UPI0038019FB9